MKNFPSSSSLKNDDFFLGQMRAQGKFWQFFLLYWKMKELDMAKKNLSKKLSSERSAKPQRQKKRRRALSSTVLLPYKKMGPIWQMLGGPDEGMPIDIPRCFKFGPEYAQHQNNFWIYRCQPIYYLFSPLTYLIKYKWP